MTTIPSIDRSVLTQSFNLTVPSIQAKPKTIALLKKLQQTNNEADPSVITKDLKGRLTSLQKMQNSLLDATKNQKRDEWMAYLVGALTITLIAGLVLGIVFNIVPAIIISAVLLLVLLIISNARNTKLENEHNKDFPINEGCFIFGPLILIYNLLTRKSALESEIKREEPQLLNDIQAAAKYLEENSKFIIANIEKDLKEIEKELSSVRLAEEEIRKELPKELPAGSERIGYGKKLFLFQTKQEIIGTLQHEIYVLNLMKEELEGPGQTMLQQLTSPHPGYPLTTTYTYS